MVQIVKCNRCDNTSEDDDTFTQLVVSLPVIPEKQQVRRISNLPQKWAARENSHGNSFMSLSNVPQKKPSCLHYLDLCPECTAWFSKEFLLTKEVSEEFLTQP